MKKREDIWMKYGQEGWQKVALVLGIFAIFAIFATTINYSGGQKTQIGDITLSINQDPFCLRAYEESKNYDGTKIFDIYCGVELIPRDGLPPSVFRKLPAIPTDFLGTVSLFKNGKLPEFCDKLGPEYWSQPEFVSTFQTSGIATMQGLASGKPVAEIGYGTYPSEYTMQASSGSIATVCTYWMTGWGVARYQITGFTTDFNQNKQIQFSAFPDGSRNSSGIENASRYFKVSFDPTTMITGRTYGYFDPNWIQKLSIIVQVAPNTPKGRYFITINPAPINEKEYANLVWKYKTYAHFVGTGFDQIPDQGFLTIGVEIV